MPIYDLAIHTHTYMYVSVLHPLSHYIYNYYLLKLYIIITYTMNLVKNYCLMPMTWQCHW